jgi:hypothetical protein
MIDPKHIENAVKARALYLDNLKPEESAADWYFAESKARKDVAAALRESAYLSDIGAALRRNGGHGFVFRQLLAPPLSQDQFKLVCKSWSKTAENNSKPMRLEAANEAALVIRQRLSRGIVRWNIASGPKSRHSVATLMRVASILMASQRVSTGRRTRLAEEQEQATTRMLEEHGWVRLPSKLIDTRAAVPPRHFMHKTRFATNTTTPQEVDIACGLSGSYVLAMECKVTNDETNSVKRINDVLKKARAWKDHWGSFVRTAALLQGVIAAKDVQRLSDAGVLVFWSHDLNEFQNWLSTNIA